MSPRLVVQTHGESNLRLALDKVLCSLPEGNDLLDDAVGGRQNVGEGGVNHFPKLNVLWSVEWWLFLGGKETLRGAEVESNGGVGGGGHSGDFAAGNCGDEKGHSR